MDLTIVLQDIALNSNWLVYHDMGGSDHFPTICEFSFNYSNYIAQNNRRIYAIYIEKECKNQNSDIDYDYWSTIIKTAADKCIPLSKGKGRIKCTPW